MADEHQPPKMNADALWREEIFTDREIGTVRRLSPVKPDGSPDLARKTMYVGEASLMTPGGALPLTFELPAADLAAAIAGFGAGLEKAYQDTMAELQEMRRKAQSQIVIPKGGMPPNPPPGRSKLEL